jgi:hypothetical protein
MKSENAEEWSCLARLRIAPIAISGFWFVASLYSFWGLGTMILDHEICCKLDAISDGGDLFF